MACARMDREGRGLEYANLPKQARDDVSGARAAECAGPSVVSVGYSGPWVSRSQGRCASGVLTRSHLSVVAHFDDPNLRAPYLELSP